LNLTPLINLLVVVFAPIRDCDVGFPKVFITTAIPFDESQDTTLPEKLGDDADIP
jgi:hypothetical protein